MRAGAMVWCGMSEPLTPDVRDALRQILLGRLAELQEVDGMSAESRRPVELDQQSVGRLSRMDAIQQQAMAVAAQGRRQHDIRLINQTLARMETDDFGYCVRCGEAIAPDRLRLDPTVTLCIACAND